VYDKPMIYYPLSVLMLAGIREILVITTPEDRANFERLLGNGSRYGIEICYAEQPKPEGLAQAFIIGRDFIGKDSVALVLGDNIFYGASLPQLLRAAAGQTHGATIFGYYVNNPERFGVVKFNEHDHVVDIVEKPAVPPSNYAVTGLYFYDNQVVEMAKTIKPSARGELEITAINNLYLQQNELKLEKLGRGFAWLDTGTYDSMLDAGNFIRTIELQQGLQVACLEEIGYNNRWLSAAEIAENLPPLMNTNYGKYLQKMLS